MSFSTPAPSGTLTSSAPQPTSSCATNQAYILPTLDAACAVPNTDPSYEDLMSSCCGSADVIGFDDGCGLYCLAVDQTIEDLQDCLFDRSDDGENGGVANQSVYCGGKQNATATDPGAALPSGATVVVDNGGGSSGGNGNGDGDDDGGDDGGEGSGAGRTMDTKGISKLGMTVAGLLFSVTALGAFQL